MDIVITNPIRINVVQQTLMTITRVGIMTM